MPRTFSLATPADYLLQRDACSYGYFLLAPNHWEPASRAFSTVLDLPGGAAALTITQGNAPRVKRGIPLTIASSRSLTAADQRVATALLTRMLRLDEPAATIKAFHTLDPRFKPLGRGRLMRSPTMFEDVIKTVTSCNVAWPSTVNMNTLLCHHYGSRVSTNSADTRAAFPRAETLAKLRPANLRGRCRVGYRDARLVELSRMFAKGQIDPAWFENPATSDQDVREALIELPGIGPYAAANIMQLLGRYAHLPLDSESVRHGRVVLGFKGTDRAIMKRIDKHFAPFGEHRFRSYWFELWAFYEAKRGMSWTWQREIVGKSFTAAQLK